MSGPPLPPLDIGLSLHAQPDDELYDALLSQLLVDGSSDLHLEELHELVAAVENGLGADLIADLLPVDVLDFDGIVGGPDVAIDHFVVVE